MPATALTIAVGDYGHTRLLKEASVRPQGLALQPVEVPSLVELVRRMARGLEFDIAELSLSHVHAGSDLPYALHSHPGVPVAVLLPLGHRLSPRVGY